MVSRALLFLDVDGTLLPNYGEKLDATLVDWQEWQTHRNPRLPRIDRSLGQRLQGLACDLVWATAWMHDLPEAPLVDPIGTVGWKTAALVAAAEGRRFVWLDDEISDIDRAWVSTHHEGVALLHCVDSRSGLTEADLTTVGEWLDFSESETGQVSES
ncbi:HAD domain-containing protein [Mycolicibacterium helvum]|uniref:Secreted protein n=1 Tax=Mycolicibacterium helvum TaxID=1534349 RepID=A0A7I7T401_9MYCO|nr:hypothetical protein [Mycolicibacterium helvum]BBY64012.1 hypothetical protein MHEL_22550 [Mycolicibacterium helvum]